MFTAPSELFSLKKLKRLFVFSIILFVVYFSLTSFVKAQDDTAPASADNWGPFEQQTFQIGDWKDALQDCYFLDGTAGLRANAKCSIVDSGTGNLYVASKLPQGGALAGVGKVITAMYTNPPTSSTEYLADLGSNLGLVQTAYAQNVVGSGDGVIRPVLRVWQVTRNISYVGFILVFLAVGFMIMFRQKLNPQTVVTIQSALPGLVIGLILVTFSYFIAAFIVDLCFVSMQLVAYVFQAAGGNVVSNPVALSREGSVVNLWGTFAFNRDNWGLIKDAVQQSFLRALPADSIQGIGGTGLFRIGAEALGFGLGGIFTFIVIVALFIQMMRLLWQLVMSYVSIILMTVTGPFLILLGSIPGRGSATTMWWKTILGNVLVFPAVFAAFLMAGLFFGQTQNGNFGTSLPLFAGLPIDMLRVILAFGVLLGTPAIPGTVKKFVGVTEIGDIAKSAQGGFAAGLAPVNAVTKPIRSAREAYTAQEAKDRAASAGKITAATPWGKAIQAVQGRYIKHGIGL